MLAAMGPWYGTQPCLERAGGRGEQIWARWPRLAKMARMVRGSPYRGRIAPSPSGLLHLGHAHTFWIAAQRAAHERGTLVLRNEDLDPERSRPKFVDCMLEDLQWLGLRWSEGPDCGGPHRWYSQSQRRDYYLAAWRKLRDGRWIYPCTCSRKDLREVATAPHDSADEPIYPGRCRHSDATKFQDPQGVNWRFRVREGEQISFVDMHLGHQSFVAGRDFGDFLVWRRDDVPAYQLAVVVDDNEMEISEVVRGADLLKSTARQFLLFRALAWPTPRYYHCDLVCDEAGVRLAKRHDALSIRKLRQQGMSPVQVLALASRLAARQRPRRSSPAVPSEL